MPSTVYLNALLASLNARKSLKEAAAAQVPSYSTNGIHLPSMRNRSNTSYPETGTRVASTYNVWLPSMPIEFDAHLSCTIKDLISNISINVETHTDARSDSIRLDTLPVGPFYSIFIKEALTYPTPTKI